MNTSLSRKCGRYKNYLVLSTQNRTHCHLCQQLCQQQNVTHLIISMKTSAAPKARQIQSVRLQSSKTSMTSTVGSTSNLCHLQYLKPLLIALLENAQITLHQLEMHQAELQRSAQAMHQLVTPDLAVIKQKWDPDRFGLVWIYQAHFELYSQYLWALMDNWTECPFELTSHFNEFMFDKIHLNMGFKAVVVNSTSVRGCRDGS